LARGGGEHLDAAELRELQRETADATRGAMNDERVSGFEAQCIIDPLDRGQSGRRDSPGLLQGESLRNVANALRRHSDVLGVEAAVGVIPAVGIDLVADLEALHLL